ncbi:MAG: class I SAM-dependent methyltransferase, partial [Deltaproteobacteria bacterium]|nr:class I SAM-dependent methyltransferase [Deltaproteobacteria bacterium]
MKMNRLEKWIMNNPLRAAIQRHYAAPILAQLGGETTVTTALEIGCGNGVGVEIILDRFRAVRVDAFDLDEELVAMARQRLARRGSSVRLWTGSATEIEAEDASYDAVFAFGVLHHLPDWRIGLAEVVRVLRPDGVFFAEESYASFITHPVWRRVMDHPQDDRFDHAQLRASMKGAGLLELGEKLALGGGSGW